MWDSNTNLLPNSRLQGLYAAFRAIPYLAAYFKGPKYKLPCNNRMAKWLSKGVVGGKQV